MLGSLGIGDGTTTVTIGFLAITNILLWEPTDGFTATGFRVGVAGYGSKAIGAIEQSQNRYAKKLCSRSTFVVSQRCTLL